MTIKNAKNIATFGIVMLFSLASANAYAEESEGYKMVGDITPVLTFTFRDGIETYEFPVFEMGENYVDNSETSFSVEGTVTHSPLLYKAMDDAYQYRFSHTSSDHQFKIFDVSADFVKDGESVFTLEYNDCRIDNYQVETLDSNDFESYFKEVGFAIVDKIDFVCNGVNFDNDVAKMPVDKSLTDYGESGFKFANDMKTSVTFLFDNGVEKMEYPVFNLISGYSESTDNEIVEFQVEGVLDYYPLLYNAIEQSRWVSGQSVSFNTDFDALVEFTNGESTLRGFDFADCRISDAQITTNADKEEGFTGKSGFVIVHQLNFTCSGIDPLNMYFDELRGDNPVWKSMDISNEYVEPIQNTDKGLSALTTFTFSDGVETIEFSMFKQNDVLSSTSGTGDTTVIGAASYPTLEFRGIVGDYPMLYDYVDDVLKVHGVEGAFFNELVEIDVELKSGEEIIRGFNYENCRPMNYVVSTSTNNEESYVKDKFALENIFDFECQGYHPNNPTYNTMYDTEKADTESSFDLRDTQDWSPGFTSQS